jgi:rare lipoprotein A
VRGCILVLASLLLVAGPSLGSAKPLPKAYGYGRVPGAPEPVLDLRGLLPAAHDAELTAFHPKVSSPLPAIVWTPAPAAVPATALCYPAGREGGLTASGEAYNGEALAAAHRDMELSSLALVRNTENGKEIIVRVNDRPRNGAAMEFTPAAARALGLSDTCAAPLSVSRLGAAPYAAKAQPLAQQMVSEPAPRTTVASGTYLVQIGAFAQRGNAESAREQVAAAGPVSVEPAIVGGASLFRVRLGPWATREEAEQARAAAAGLGFPGAKLLLP